MTHITGSRVIGNDAEMGEPRPEADRKRATVTDILRAGVRRRIRRKDMAAAQSAWDSEGGAAEREATGAEGGRARYPIGWSDDSGSANGVAGLGKQGCSPRLASAALTDSTAGSEPWGSQIRSSRETAAPGISIHPIPTCAHRTETLCSAEKPSVPKNFRPLRSRINPRQRTAFTNAHSVRVLAFDPSMSPYTLTMAAVDVIHRVSNRTA